MIALLFDTETTGLPAHPSARMEVQPYIVEWGGVLVDGDLEVFQELDVIIKPGKVVKGNKRLLDWAGIERISGLTRAELEAAPTFAEVVEQIRLMFAAADVLVAHNLPFDKTLMELELERLGITDWPWPERNVCTVQEHAEEWGRRPKLTELYEYYTATKLDQKHRALDDVMALLTVCIESGVLECSPN